MEADYILQETPARWQMIKLWFSYHEIGWLIDWLSRTWVGCLLLLLLLLKTNNLHTVRNLVPLCSVTKRHHTSAMGNPIHGLIFNKSPLSAWHYWLPNQVGWMIEWVQVVHHVTTIEGIWHARQKDMIVLFDAPPSPLVVKFNFPSEAIMGPIPGIRLSRFAFAVKFNVPSKTIMAPIPGIRLPRFPFAVTFNVPSKTTMAPIPGLHLS